MEKADYKENKSGNAETTTELLEHAAALKKKTLETSEKLKMLKRDSEKLLHPEKE